MKFEIPADYPSNLFRTDEKIVITVDAKTRWVSVEGAEVVVSKHILKSKGCVPVEVRSSIVNNGPVVVTQLELFDPLYRPRMIVHRVEDEIRITGFGPEKNEGEILYKHAVEPEPVSP